MHRQVLVIDDSPKIQALVRAILAKEPVDLHTATDPAYGLVLAASVKPDLILLDIDMPGMDGFDACRRLKADPATADCPVIFLTAHSTPTEKVHGFGLGAVDYVTKPFNAAELCMRVRASLRTRGAIKALEEKALIDTTTGLGNRAMFDARLAAEVQVHARTETTLAVVAVELGGLAAARQRHGTRVARQILKRIAKSVRELCRVEDVACRLAGDTLAVLMPQSDAAAATALATQFHTQIEKARYQPPGGTAEDVIRITARVGVAASERPYDRTMLERAQAAMPKPAGRLVTVAA